MHQLIRELAEYEKEPEAVTNTVEGLIHDGFEGTKCFDCFVAELDEEIIGFALYYQSYSTWKGPCLYLEDLLVTEKLRGKGIGSKLFERVYDEAKQRGVKRFEWQVLDWNEPAINFYRKYGTDFYNDWMLCKINL